MSKISGQGIDQGSVRKDGSESERIMNRAIKTGDQKIEIGTILIL